MKTLSRIDWLAWRNHGIGSSDAPVVMNASPWSTPFELWARKTGRLRPQPTNWAMQRGLDLEPRAREEYERLTGIPMPATRLEHPDHRFIRATFDGLNLDAKRVLEIKCPGNADHVTAIQGKIPDKYLWQCVHLIFVAQMKTLDYFSFDGFSGVLVTMKRDVALENRLFKEESIFWKHVVKDTPPPHEMPKPKSKKRPSVLKSDGVFPIRRTR